MKRLIVVAVMALAVGLCGVAGADNAILNVPDWNQPSAYPAPVPVGGYGNWCSPTAAANALGYWEDVMGKTKLTDQQAFALSPAYPATAGTWQQGLFNDGSVEMGWHMNTGGWQSVPQPFPPGVGTTPAANIGPGIFTYASTGWVDGGTGIVKQAYPNIVVTTESKLDQPPAQLATMWPKYTAEIDAGRPVVSTFLHWVTIPFFNTVQINVGGQPITVEQYLFNPATEEHTVTGVGYLDQTPGVFHGDGTEYFIVHDNWGTTGTWVAVAVDVNWFQNDYIDFTSEVVPEPAGLGLIGLALLAVRRRRR